MSTIKLAAVAAAAFLFAVPASALAESSRLQLIIGGEAYDGPPRFEVSFDGTVLGEAAIDAAIDTATTGRFAEAADRAAHVENIEIAIPENLFSPTGEVRVRLVNEAFGGEGSNRDRNLFLAAVTVNGRAVTVSGLNTVTAAGAKDNILVGEFLLLEDGNVEGVAAAPAGGWPQPDATIAVVEPGQIEPTPAVVTAAAADAADAPAPAVIANLKVPAAAASVETASIAGDPASSCGLDQLYNVIGFNESSNDLTPRLTERLDQIVADIGKHKCTVQVIGYSSTQGAHATNALFALERAQNVLRYLSDRGLSVVASSATGGGATTRFGELPSDNRRVVITVKP
jgi:outer membrane protein OmpA-like peptidoglycan-associated protein